VPRTPQPSPHTQAIRANTFVAFQARLREVAASGDLIPLHLGDTYLLPPEAARRIDLDDADLHRYGPVGGDEALRALAAADMQRLGLETSAERVFVSAGSTGGLDLSLNAVLAPGDEVLVLTPSWPLIFGLLQRRGCVPVEVDVDPSGWLPDDAATLAERVAAAITPRTCGIYFCDPNNPAGFVYGEAHHAALAGLAREHGLWLFHDAVYADLVFGVERPRPFAALDADLQARTFVLMSYSKSLGLAGHRVGAVSVPPAIAPLFPRLTTHSTYHCSRSAQRMAIAALEADDAAEDRAARCAMARDGAALVDATLTAVPFHRAQAGAFVLLDLRERAADDEAGLALLSRCLDVGVSLAPGTAFGASWGRFARLCYTATPPEQLEEGLRRLQGVLAE
jgi:aspartate/methionine/tyrosine aminotransferase